MNLRYCVSVHNVRLTFRPMAMLRGCGKVALQPCKASHFRPNLSKQLTVTASKVCVVTFNWFVHFHPNFETAVV